MTEINDYVTNCSDDKIKNLYLELGFYVKEYEKNPEKFKYLAVYAAIKFPLKFNRIPLGFHIKDIGILNEEYEKDIVKRNSPREGEINLNKVYERAMVRAIMYGRNKSQDHIVSADFKYLGFTMDDLQPFFRLAH